MFFKKMDIKQKNVDFVNVYILKKLEETFIKEVYDSNLELEKAGVSQEALKLEIIGIMLELYSTAFAIYDFNKAIDQSVSLKEHLYDLGEKDYWDAMEPYNKIVAESATAGLDPNSAAWRSKAGYITKMRFNLAKDYIAKHGEEKSDEAVGRAINRFGVARNVVFEGTANEACGKLGLYWLTPDHVESWYKDVEWFVKN